MLQRLTPPRLRFAYPPEVCLCSSTLTQISRMHYIHSRLWQLRAQDRMNAAAPNAGRRARTQAARLARRETGDAAGPIPPRP